MPRFANFAAAVAVVCALGSWLTPPASAAVVVQQGDVIVSEEAGSQLIHIDRATGDRTVFSKSAPGGVTGFGPALSGPAGLAFSEDGTTLYVVDSVLEAVFSVDRVTGDRTLVSDGKSAALGVLLSGPQDIALSTSGAIAWVTSTQSATIISVNLATGARALVSGLGVGSGDPLSTPRSLALRVGGELAVVDTGPDTLLGVIPSNGNRSVISDFTKPGPVFVQPWGVEARTNGNIFVIDRGAQTLFEIFPPTGQRFLASGGGAGGGLDLLAPEGVTFDAGATNPTVVVTDTGRDAVFTILVAGGLRSVLSGTGIQGVGPALTSLNLGVVVAPEGPPITLDFGDAPASFGTLLGNDGARHVIAAGLYLGAGVTADADGKPSDASDADLDDGVSFPAKLDPGLNETIGFTSSGPGFVDAWIDWNSNGTFEHPAERVVNGMAVTAGLNEVVLAIPAGVAAGPRTARVRLSRTGGLEPNGLTVGGEVEDWQVIVAPPTLDLVLAPSGPAGPVATGEVATWELTVTNAGNLESAVTTLSATIPPGTTFSAGSSSAGWSCPVPPACSINMGSMAPDAVDARTFSVTVDGTVDAGLDVVQLLAAVSSDGASGVETTPLNNEIDDSATLDAAPDLAVELSDADITAVAGGGIVYAITVVNDGDQGATGLELKATVPAHTTFDVASSTAGWSCVDGAAAATVCQLDIASLDAGANTSRAFGVKVAATLGAGVVSTQLDVTVADDEANGEEGSLADNEASETTPITAAPALWVEADDGVDSAAPGAFVTYTLDYANQGTQAATNVELFHFVPSHTVVDLALSTAGWDCAPMGPGNLVGCTLALGTVEAGTTGQASFVVKVAATLPTGVTDTTLITNIFNDDTNGQDPDLIDNVATVLTVLNAAPDLVVTLDDAGVTTSPGALQGYGVSWANVGTQDAAGVTVRVTVPANTKVSVALTNPDFNCAAGGGAGDECTLTVGELKAGDDGGVLFAVEVDAAVPAGVEALSTSAVVADDDTNGDDLTPEDDAVTVETPLEAEPDLTIEVSEPAPAVPGAGVSWTLSWTQEGDQGAVGVVLTAVVPPASRLDAEASDAGWSCPVEGAPGEVCELSLGALAAGESGSVVFAVTLDETVASGVAAVGGAVTLADDGANGADPTPDNNAGALAVEVVAAPDFVVSLSDADATGVPGGAVVYTVTAQNVGAQDAVDVEVVTQVPTATSLDAVASTAGWSCAPPATGGAGCVFELPTLAAGETVELIFVVVVDETLPAGLEETALGITVGDQEADGEDPTPLNAVALETTPLEALPELGVLLSDADAITTPGGQVTYMVSWDNLGSQDASGVEVVVVVPEHSTWVSGPFVCVPDMAPGALCTLELALLEAGTGDSAEVVLAVDQPLADGAIEVVLAAAISDDGKGGADAVPDNDTAVEATPIDTQPELSIAALDVDEGVGTAEVALTLSRATGLPVTAAWGTSDGEAVHLLDYTGVSDLLILAPGETTAVLPVAVLDDLLDEPSESFTVAVSTVLNGTEGVVSALVTIADNDEPPTVSIADGSAFESGGTLTFVVSLSAPSAKTIEMSWATEDAEAEAGVDYVAASGTLVIEAGEVVGEIVVDVLDDDADEPDEIFLLNLSGLVNADVFADAQGAGKVIDDDSPPVVTLSGESASEGAAAVVFTVSLSHPSGLVLSFDWATTAGTALAGDDFVAASGVLELQPGEVEGTITIVVVDDDLDEPGDGETLSLTISSSDEVVLDVATAQSTIVDDDATPVAEADAYETDEGTALIVSAPGVLDNDTDADGPSTLQVTVADPPASGSLALAADGSFVYTPSGDFAGSDSFTYTVSDGTNTSATATVSLTVLPVNDAPVVDPAVALTLTPVDEDSTGGEGDTVADILGSGAAPPVSDVDAGALSGVAVVGADSDNGEWSWSIDDGETWTVLGVVADDAALLLDDVARLRFVPVPDFDGEASVQLVAWDQSAGATGDAAADASVGGGTSAFSLLATSAVVDVLPVNDPPVFVAPTPTETLVGAEGVLLAFDVAVSDPDGPTLAYSVEGLPAGASFDGVTGAFEWTPGFADGGSHALVITASDTLDEAEVAVTIEVTVIDLDGDGLPDTWEAGAGLVEGSVDSDEDTISDAEEVGDFLDPVDTDGDEIIDALDEDSDNDGLLDVDEAGDDDLATPAVDTDEDGTPDYRDLDSDNDGADDAVDVCPTVVDVEQADLDEDGVGDLCDEDIDGDGVSNEDELAADLDPFNPDTDGDGIDDGTEVGDDPKNPLDSDDDGIIDALDLDSDGDGIPDSVEAGDDDLATPPVDTDGDGVPDALDLDSDGDGIPDSEDLCPIVVDEGADFDGDGIGDLCDGDRDGDGVDDVDDLCPGIADTDQVDTDGDGEGDACDADDDNDGVLDEFDTCPTSADADQIDLDGDGIGDACDPDVAIDAIIGGGCAGGSGGAPWAWVWGLLLAFAMVHRRTRRTDAL